LNAAPVVAFSNPTTGSRFSTSICPAIAASDDKRVVRVRIYLDDVERINDDSAPWGSCFNTRSVPRGVHTLKARAFDAEGASTATVISVTRK
jgi:hypothetical protein